MLEDALLFTLSAHTDQRYSDKPYHYHLDDIIKILADYPVEAQILGCLYSILDDTEITSAEIRLHFGDLIGDCVDLLTEGPGLSRQERIASIYKKLTAVSGPMEIVLIVKVAVRLANVNSCIVGLNRNHSLLTIYRNEHATFKAAAYRDGLCDPLWLEIEKQLKK